MLDVSIGTGAVYGVNFKGDRLVVKNVAGTINVLVRQKDGSISSLSIDNYIASLPANAVYGDVNSLSDSQKNEAKNKFKGDLEKAIKSAAKEAPVALDVATHGTDKEAFYLLDALEAARGNNATNINNSDLRVTYKKPYDDSTTKAQVSTNRDAVTGRTKVTGSAGNLDQFVEAYELGRNGSKPALSVIQQKSVSPSNTGSGVNVDRSDKVASGKVKVKVGSVDVPLDVQMRIDNIKDVREGSAIVNVSAFSITVNGKPIDLGRHARLKADASTATFIPDDIDGDTIVNKGELPEVKLSALLTAMSADIKDAYGELLKELAADLDTIRAKVTKNDEIVEGALSVSGYDLSSLRNPKGQPFIAGVDQVLLFQRGDKFFAGIGTIKNGRLNAPEEYLPLSSFVAQLEKDNTTVTRADIIAGITGTSDYSLVDKRERVVAGLAKKITDEKDHTLRKETKETVLTSDGAVIGSAPRTSVVGANSDVPKQNGAAGLPGGPGDKTRDSSSSQPDAKIEARLAALEARNAQLQRQLDEKNAAGAGEKKPDDKASDAQKSGEGNPPAFSTRKVLSGIIVAAATNVLTRLGGLKDDTARGIATLVGGVAGLFMDNIPPVKWLLDMFEKNPELAKLVQQQAQPSRP